MTILWILIPIALGLGISALIGFLFCANSGQYDDLDTPAYRALLDDLERKRKDADT